MGAARAITLLHVVSGTIVLIVAPLALAVAKGGLWHRRWGAAFLWAMAGVTGTAALMWQAKGHLFLVWLDAITVYLLVYGRRVLVRRSAPGADPFDVAAALLVIAAGGILAGAGSRARAPLMHELQWVMIALGGIGATFGGLDLFKAACGAKQRFGWFFYHLSAMLSAYISAATAFIVINAHGVPMLLRWTVPVGIGTAIIVAFSAKHRLRFHRALGARRERARAAAAAARVSA